MSARPPPDDRQAGGNEVTQLRDLLPQGGFSLAWELDLWGRFRRATEAARADLLATEDFRRTVVLTLISDVARAYFELRELDLELEISRQTLASRADYVRLTKAREQGGVATLLDVRQAEQLYFSAAATIADLRAAHRAAGEPDQRPDRECTPRPSPEGARSTRARPWPRPCRRASRPICWRAGPTSCRPSSSWWPPTRASARRRRCSFPRW